MTPMTSIAGKGFSKEDIHGLLKQKGLDFTVGKVQTPNGVPGHRNEETGFFTSYRKDTGKVFNTGLTDRWHTIQNKDVFNCVADLSKVTNTKLMDIRSFNDGAEIAAQIELGTPQYVDKGNGGGGALKDKITNFLCVLFAHDGSRALSLYMNGKRWSCNNMINPSFRAAVAANKRSKKALITIQHSENAGAKMNQLVKGVTLANNEFNCSMDLYRNLRNTKMDKTLLKDVMQEYFLMTKKQESGKKKLSTRQKNNLKKEMSDIRARFNYADGGIQPVDCAWNMYNSIQGHIQHYTTRKAGVSDAGYKSTLIGANETTAAQMLRVVIEMSLGMQAVNFGELAKR